VKEGGVIDAAIAKKKAGGVCGEKKKKKRKNLTKKITGRNARGKRGADSLSQHTPPWVRKTIERGKSPRGHDFISVQEGKENAAGPTPAERKRHDFLSIRAYPRGKRGPTDACRTPGFCEGGGFRRLSGRGRREEKRAYLHALKGEKPACCVCRKKN